MCFNVISLYLFKRRKPVEITLGLVQVSLEKVDLRRRSVTVGLWLRISWHDEYLIWNVTDYDETSIVSLDSKKVQVGKDQEKAQSEKDSHSKNRGGKKPN